MMSEVNNNVVCSKDGFEILGAFDNLRNAIIVQAAKDLKNSIRKLKNPKLSPDTRFKHIHRIEECKLFFNGEWIKELTDVDGPKLLKMILEDANEGDDEECDDEF